MRTRRRCCSRAAAGVPAELWLTLSADCSGRGNLDRIKVRTGALEGALGWVGARATCRCSGRLLGLAEPVQAPPQCVVCHVIAPAPAPPPPLKNAHQVSVGNAALARGTDFDFTVDETSGAATLTVLRLAWPAANGPEASVMLAVEFPRGHTCATKQFEDKGPCPTDGCEWALTARPGGGGGSGTDCCWVYGHTLDAFTPDHLARHNPGPNTARFKERYLFIGGARAQGATRGHMPRL